MAETKVKSSPAELLESARRILADGPARLATVVATDDRAVNGAFGLRYVFSRDRGREFVTLETSVPLPDPCFPSLVPLVPAACLFEREVQEFFGLLPKGSPDLRGLILHSDWPEGLHPLRNDFQAVRRVPQSPERPYEFLRVEGDGVFEIPVGPVHAGIIEPGHFRFSVAGEPIIHLETRLGYVHKGVEKLAEGQGFSRGVLLSERVSGDAAFAHSLAFCQAAESLSGVEAPPRARMLRLICAELERLHCHLADIAGIATDVGFSFAAMQAQRLRELVLRRNARLCGDRFLKGVNRPGGVSQDLDASAADGLADFLKGLCVEFSRLKVLMLETDSFMDRLDGTGILPRQTAVDLAGVGPAARASGVDLDLRRDHPYAAYGGFQLQVPVRDAGDVAARLAVKMEEFLEAAALASRAIKKLPEGSCGGPMEPPREGAQALGWAESSRGEVVHWLRAGRGGTIARLKIKDPSFVNWPLLPWAVRGNIVPDFPLINKSFNLSYSGNDR